MKKSDQPDSSKVSKTLLKKRIEVLHTSAEPEEVARAYELVERHFPELTIESVYKRVHDERLSEMDRVQAISDLSNFDHPKIEAALEHILESDQKNVKLQAAALSALGRFYTQRILKLQRYAEDAHPAISNEAVAILKTMLGEIRVALQKVTGNAD